MKGKNIILVGVGTSVIAISLKAAFNFGVKMGIATLLSGLSSKELSEIIPEEKGGWYKDILQITRIIQERRKRNA